MAEFPLIEWKNIDSRQVPFTKPQHYKKGSTKETDLTGHDNPLPVANYTQSDSGLWLPTSKDNPVPTQVTGSSTVKQLVTERDIYNRDTFFMVNAPKGSRIGYLYIRVSGVTGTFGDGEGYKIQTRFRIGDNSIPAGYETEWLTDPLRMVQGVGLGMSDENIVDPGLSGQFVAIGVHPTEDTNIILRLRGGEFEEGEGIDLEVFADWYI